MSENITLGEALKTEGSSDQIDLCTDAILKLSKEDCVSLLQGHDAGLTLDDKKSFNRMCRERVNNTQPVLPWKDVKLDTEVNPNW